MKEFRQWLAVEPLNGKFAVVRREQWDKGANAILADGPFDDQAEAERARDLIEARDQATKPKL